MRKTGSVPVFLLWLFAAAAGAGELEARVHAELERRGLGEDALLIPDNVLRHEMAVPRDTPALVRELMARPLAAADAAALFERSVPRALREFQVPLASAEDFETLLERYLGALAAPELTRAGFLEATARFARGLRAPGVRFPAAQRRDTPIGTLSIGSPGDDAHGSQAALIVDPGGNDSYERAPQREGAVSVIVDLAGNDRYGGSDLARGARSALIDFSGDDRYAMDTGLGAASEGVSVLVDAGGNDSYRVRARGQGYAAAGGLGILWDLAGDDTYVAEGEADPWQREGGLSFAQGVAAGERGRRAGGIGILRDDAGDDRYEAQLFAQGTGFHFGLGLLWDRAGADRYRAVRYAQGAGVHQAVGVLRDDHGDDSYALSAGVGQGVGHDVALGLLVDLAGEDRYAAQYVAQGSALDNGLGLLADLAGSGHWSLGADARAWGKAEGARGLPSIGVLVHDPARAAFVRPELPARSAPAGGAARCPPPAERAGAVALSSVLRELAPGLAAGKPDGAAYGDVLRRLLDDPQAALAQVAGGEFWASWALGQILPCAAAGAPDEAAARLWAAFERLLAQDPHTPLADMIAHALRRRAPPPATQQRLLAALDAHGSCGVRALALWAWPSAPRARAALASRCWREQAVALGALRRLGEPAPRDAAPLPSFLGREQDSP